MRNWEQATRCRCCGSAFATRVERPRFQPFSVAGEFLPTLLIRGRLLAQTIELTREKIVIRTPGTFGLSQREEEIAWAKVAGFDYHSGIFWDAVTIETRGQSASRIGCLSKSDGRQIREVLRMLEL